jgi:methylisocitrate lyase
MTDTAGSRWRAALDAERPLQVIGTINAHHAHLARRAGFRAIYLSGGGVAAGSLGMPALDISTLDDALTDVRRITDVCNLPLLADADTGFGVSAFNVARATRSLDTMQTRAELYDVIGYHDFEARLDALRARDARRSP